jgi:hypothetical protein
MPRKIADLEVYSTIEAVQAEEPPEGRWIAKPIIPTVGKFLVYGDPNDYKTFTMFDFLLAYASNGTYFGGLPVEKAGTALFITAEGDIYDTGARLRMLMRGHKDKDPNNVDLYMIHDSIHLNTPRGLQQFNDLLVELEPGLVLFDPLRHFIPGVDENDATQMGLFCENMNGFIRSYRFSLGFIHHASKKGKPRGSSVLEGWVDSMLQFVCERGIELHDTEQLFDVITVRQKKARNAKYSPDTLLVPVFDNSDEPTETVYYAMLEGMREGDSPATVEAAQRVLAWHKRRGLAEMDMPFSVNQAVQSIKGGRPNKIKAALTFLHERGLAEKADALVSTGQGRTRSTPGWRLLTSTIDNIQAMLSLMKKYSEVPYSSDPFQALEDDFGYRPDDVEPPDPEE